MISDDYDDIEDADDDDYGGLILWSVFTLPLAQSTNTDIELAENCPTFFSAFPLRNWSCHNTLSQTETRNQKINLN